MHRHHKSDKVAAQSSVAKHLSDPVRERIRHLHYSLKNNNL